MFKKLVFFMSVPLCLLWASDFTQEQVMNYHRRLLAQEEALESIIQSGFFAGAHKVLDVGCGDGRITAQLARKFPETTFIGCDISKAMLEFASKTYPSSDYPNLIFVEKDGCNLGYEKEFDRVICVSSLHWMSQQETALASFYSALKPKGRVYILASPKSSHNDFKTISLKVILSFKWAPQFLGFKSSSSFHSERSYKKMAQKVGFSVDRIEQKKQEMIFPDKASLCTYLTAILTPVAYLPCHQRVSFLDDYYDALYNHGNVDKQGKVHIRFEEIELELSHTQVEKSCPL